MRRRRSSFVTGCRKHVQRSAKQHINVASEVVTAAAANDQGAFDEADPRWHQNATDIANAAHAVNPR